MKVLVTGTGGQLGYDILKKLKELGISSFGSDRNLLDFTDLGAVKKTFQSYMPTHVIHCAAYTAVDKAEDSKEVCYEVNVIGTKNIVEACKEIDATLIYFSTDYVFNGKGSHPFEVDDTPDPVNYYGETKYHGELIIQEHLLKYFILRISWVFGMNGNNFVKTMLRIAEKQNEINVVSDQYGSPTYTVDAAEFTCKLIMTTNYGVYHVTNDGFCSWYEFACEIFKKANINTKINAIMTNDFPTRAIRPKNSRLSKEGNATIFLDALPSWHNALCRYLLEYEAEKGKK